MNAWKFWDWVAYACLLVAAILLAAKEPSEHIPSMHWLSAPFWSFVPLILVAIASALLIARSLGWIGPRQTVDSFAPPPVDTTEKVDVSGERVPLVWLFQEAWNLDVVSESPDSTWLIAFGDALRQAGLDGVVAFWGRPKRHQLEQIIKREPLNHIPKDHWKDFEVDWLKALHVTSKGEAVSVSKENFQVGTRTYLKDKEKECFADLHVDKAQAQRWLRKWKDEFRSSARLDPA